MSQWLKNICLNPFKYGLSKVNYLIVNSLTIIFNMYGKRLLKMDTDKIIEKNECRDDRNIFYLYPLQFKKIIQEIGLNTILIDNSTINGLTISVPWTSVLTETTDINIFKIHLDIEMSHHFEQSMPESLDMNESYFARKIDGNQDLIHIFHDISNLLIQYFNQICSSIQLIEIKVNGQFEIVIENFRYQKNIVSIEDIKINSMHGEKLAQCNNITYHILNSYFHIGNVRIDPLIFDYFPEFYTAESNDPFHLSLEIDSFSFDLIQIKNLAVELDTKQIIINHLGMINIENLFILEGFIIASDQKTLMHYDIDLKKFTFNQTLDIKMGNIHQLVQWIMKTIHLFDILSQKIIFIGENNNHHVAPEFVNLDLNILYNEDIFRLQINNLSINENIVLNQIYLVHNNVLGNIEQIIIHDGLITINNGKLNSDQFLINTTNSIIDKSESQLKITFTETFADGIMDIVNFVSSMIDKFSFYDGKTKSEETFDVMDLSTSVLDLTVIEETKPYLVNLVLINSRLLIEYEKVPFQILFKHGNVSVTHRSVSDLYAYILMNDYQIVNIESSIISMEHAEIDKLCLHLDPEIFDQLNYLFGTLTPDVDNPDEPTIEIAIEGLKQIQEALTSSFVNHQEIEDKMSSITEEYGMEMKSKLEIPIIHILSESVNNLRMALIEDYYDPPDTTSQFDLNIKALHCFFYDKMHHIKNVVSHEQILSQSISEYTPFLHAIMKTITLHKNVELIENRTSFMKIYHTNQNDTIATKYLLHIKTGCIIDLVTDKMEWKYFAKFSKDKMLNTEIVTYDNTIRATINISNIVLNIHEATLLRLLAFFSNSHHIPNQNTHPPYIEYLNMGGIDLMLNYYPLITQQVGLNPETFSLKDFKLRLSPQIITNVVGFDKVTDIIIQKWTFDLNPKNIFQFVPNIKVIKPYATPFVNMVKIIKNYFKHAHNKKKIRTITKKINNGMDIVTSVIKSGIDHVWELFK